MLTEAGDHEELLRRFGLPADFVAGVAATLDQLTAAVDQQEEALRQRVAAGAELVVLTRAMVGTIQQLNILDRHRFRNDPAALAVWRSRQNPQLGAARPGRGELVTATPPLLPPGQSVA